MDELKIKKGDRFPDWESLYRDEEVENLPWFNKNLEKDLEEEIINLGIKGGTFLDLGTGPGTQAIALAKRGFKVTGTDISKSAINKAKKLSNEVEFVTDDILNTKLTKKFDYIFDRGLFHVISPENRQKYVKNIKGLLNEKGILFLKCFSDKQPEWDHGPHRLSKEEIKNIFSKDFNIEKIKDSLFESINLDSQPKSLFVVMKKR